MIGYLKISVFVIFAITLLSRTTYGRYWRYGDNKPSYPEEDAPEEPNQDEGISQPVT